MFVGIDLASAVMGLVLLDDKATLIHTGRYSTSSMSKTHTNWERYMVLLSNMVDLLKPYKDHIDHIYMEGVGGSHMKTLIPAVECNTLCRVLLMQMDLLDKTDQIPPTSLKKFTAGSGNAKKEHMIAQVFKKYGFMAPDSDQADAYALAMMAYKTNTGAELFVYEEEVVKKLGFRH